MTVAASASVSETPSSTVDDVSSLPPPPKHLSARQIDDLLQILGDTSSTPSLRDRSVLVPYTPFAFLEGHLKPQQDSKTGEDLLQVGSANGKTMTLPQAQAWLRSSPTAPSTKSTRSSSNVKTKPGTKSTPTSTTSPLPTSPFVEIHEEYDAEGQQTSGSVIDITQQFQSLFSKNPSAVASAPPTTPAQTDMEESMMVEVNDDAPKPISDQAYQQLSNRLDELARLEELQEQRIAQQSLKPLKKKNKKATSSGWKKGFLTTSKAKPTKPTTPSNQAKDNAETKPPATKERSKTSVSFDTTQNQVQEIPRIGTQKLPPKQGSVKASNSATVLNSDATAETSKPLDTNVFSGVIQERPMVQERTPGIIKKKKKATPTSNTAPKRLSRFARERQGGNI